MNKIHFNNITIKNFFSIGAEVHLNFNDYNGMNYVFGFNKDLNVKNGSGKSAIFIDAILFALFNKTSKGVNKSYIPHRLVGKECLVTINFDIDGINYTIENGVYPTYIKLWKKEDGKEKEDITKSSIKETSEYIEKEVLKSTFLMFRNSLVLSINDNKPVFRMGKWETRNFTEQMLNMSHIGRMYNKAKEKLNALDNTLNLKRQSVNSLERDVNEFKTKAESFSKDQKKLIQKLDNDLLDIEGQIGAMNTDDTKYIEKKTALEEKKTQLTEKFEEIKKSVSDLDIRLTEITTEIRNFENSKKKYSKVLDIICDECTKKTDEVLGIDKIKESMDERTNEMDEIKKKKAKFKALLEKIMESNKALVQGIETQKHMISKINSNRAELQYLTKELDEKTAQLAVEKKKTSPFDDLIEKYQKELNVTTDTIKEMVENRKYMDFLVFMTSEEGVRKHLLLDYVNILNNRIRNYLEEMACEYTAVFDGNFNCEFITTTGPCHYDNFSAGEKVRIDSAFMFAVRDLLFGQGTLQSNLFICDEILDASLDEYAIQSVIKILKEIAKTQTVFVISHRECVSPEDFNNIVTIKKQNGYTTIIDEDLEENI